GGAAPGTGQRVVRRMMQGVTLGRIGSFDTDAAALARRIAAHERYGENDLNAWCFAEMGVASGMAVLDLGCGTGKQTLALAARGCRVTAVDVSADALAALGAAAAARGLDGIRPVQAELDEL